MPKHRLVSWNVNGIRACAEKGLAQVIQDFSADAFCVQETKASSDQIEINKILYEPSQYQQAWSSAQKKGYSGTAIFSKLKSADLCATIGIPEYDQEGRGNLLFHKNFTLLNLYFPNGAASEERHFFKMGFLKNILSYFKELEKERGPLVICGDYNIAHKPIDIHDPVSNKDSSGFLPEERAWMDELSQSGFLDTYRIFDPNTPNQYSWWSYRQLSRQRNKGWRLDYFFISEKLKKNLVSATIHPKIQGSDHCPVSIELEF